MEKLLTVDLQAYSLPESLPANSRLKVWVRSTGYEVRFPEKKSLTHPVYWVLAITLLAGLSLFLMQSLSAYSPYSYIFLVLPLPVIAVALAQIFIAGNSNVRLDITPLTITVNHLGAGDRLEFREHVPLNEIESFYIDDNRGLGLNSAISEILYQTWIGRGLHKEDMSYLAKLIVASSKLSMQSPHPGSA